MPPKYANQQLRSVTLEVNFSGQLGTYAVLGSIQEAFADAFPLVFVPQVQSGDAVALRPFQLRSESQHRSIAVAVNQASFIAFSYEGFDSFSLEGFGVLEPILRLIKPKALTKVVYRYENEIGVSADARGFIGVERVFPGAIPAVFDGKQTRLLNAAYEHGWNDGTFSGVYGLHARTEDPSGMKVLKVQTFASAEDCRVDQLRQATGAVHRVAVDLFEDIISPAFRDLIRSGNAEEEDAG